MKIAIAVAVVDDIGPHQQARDSGHWIVEAAEAAGL
jgi:hypothetical protein